MPSLVGSEMCIRDRCAGLATILSRNTCMRRRWRRMRSWLVPNMPCWKKARPMTRPTTHRGFDNMIIKNKAIVDDDWNVLRLSQNDTPEGVAVPPGKVIVPLKVWQAQRDALQHCAELGVWLASDERAEDLQNEIAKFTVIAVDFPRFNDGRGYSIAHHLRARLGYRGELRAIGDVLRDQLFYMQRVGFRRAACRTTGRATHRRW